MARPNGEELPPTLNELMGKKESMERLEDLPEMLGEKMPEIEFNAVGRLRLLTALRNRFGEEFRNLPGITKILDDFDQEVRINKVVRKNGRR